MNQCRLTIGLILLVIGLITACTGSGREKPDPITVPPTQAEATQQIEPQSQMLMLRLESPGINMVTDLNQVTVAGVTSPDATLSVNGRLISPDPEGLFSIDLDFYNPSIPMVIEVIASSITGETKSEIRPVISSSGSTQSGMFGKVSSVTPSNITLNTESSVVTLSVDSETSIVLHGWEAPSISDITTGTMVGVIRQGARALSILAVPTRPVLTRHFTGLVTASKEGRITLVDSSNRQITADTPSEIADGDIGRLVTVVLKQDPSRGALKATAIDTALDSAGRISKALALNQKIESRQGEENVATLSWRLEELGVRNVSMLIDQRPYQGWERALTLAETTYTRLFSEHHLGTLSADVTGFITSMATSLGAGSTKLITVQPALGQPVIVKMSADTPITLIGDRIKSGQLDLASRITVRYSLEGNVANQATVMAGNTLSPGTSAQLAAIAEQGEIQGVLVDVIDTKLMVSILVNIETGQQVSLRSKGASVFRNGIPIELDSSLEGSNVFAWHDPHTYQLLEMESLNLATDEELVSGVVDSFIPKFANGNLTMRTVDGHIKPLTHHSDTVIRRNGLNVSIHDVRPGDLVRPNTKVRTSEGIDKILTLSLKTPEPGRTSGFIRGVMAGSDGQVQVTISNIWLDLISLKVNSNTKISRHGHAVGMQDLKIGQEVNLATYDLVTFETTSLALNPPTNSERVSK